MNEYLDYVFLLLAQFAGGPGPRENNLVRFGLAAMLWGGLWLISWSRQRQQELPREKLLVWGFGLGFIRNLLMFFHISGQVIAGPDAIGPSAVLTEPLEHTMSMAALVVIAGAFIRYILDDAGIARRYFQVALGATGVCFLITAWWWPYHLSISPGVKFNQDWEGWLFQIASSLLLVWAIILVARKQGWLRNVVLVALSCFLFSELLVICNFFTAVSLCPLGNALYLIGIVLLGYVYIRELFVERHQAEAALKIYRNHLEELVEQRTAELTDANQHLQQEIADRVFAEKAMRESEVRFRRVISSISDHIYMTEITAEGERINRYLSPNIEALTGYPLIKFIADWNFWPSQVIHPDDRAIAAAHALHLTMNRADVIEYRLVRSDGRTVWVRDSARIEPYGHSKIVYGVVGDITARVQVEQALELLSHQTELILASAGEGILGINQAGRHTFVNSAAANMLGYSTKELVSLSCHSTWHHSRSDGRPYPVDQCPLHSSYETGVVYRGDDEVFWRKDGSCFPVRYTSTPIFEHGELLGAVVVFSDITKRKQAEAEIKRQNEALAAQNVIAATISQSLKLDTILNTALDTVMAVLNMELGAIFLLEPDGKTLTMPVQRNAMLHGESGWQSNFGDDIPVQTIKEMKPVVLDISRYPASQLPQFMADKEIRTLVNIPLISNDRAMGVLTLGTPEFHRIQPHDVELLSGIGQQIGVALENAQLHRQVERAAILEERQRIAAEMHDGLAQTLSYMGYKVDYITDLVGAGNGRQMLDECHHLRQIIDQASQEARRSIASLQEKPRLRRSLQEWLGELVAGFNLDNSRSKVKILDGCGVSLFLPPSHIEQIIRVVQEALLNAGRHAQAQHITLTTRQRGDEMELTIEDDGCGFDQTMSESGRGDHFGLKIMRARAARIGGAVQIVSRPGYGTWIILTWPFMNDTVHLLDD